VQPEPAPHSRPAASTSVHRGTAVLLIRCVILSPFDPVAPSTRAPIPRRLRRYSQTRAAAAPLPHDPHIVSDRYNRFLEKIRARTQMSLFFRVGCQLQGGCPSAPAEVSCRPTRAVWRTDCGAGTTGGTYITPAQSRAKTTVLAADQSSPLFEAMPVMRLYQGNR
jgi:hypothetical protein